MVFFCKAFSLTVVAFTQVPVMISPAELAQNYLYQLKTIKLES